MKASSFTQVLISATVALMFPATQTKSASVTIQEISEACSGPIIKNEVIGGRGKLGDSGYEFEISADKKFNLYRSGSLISSTEKFSYQQYAECLKTLSQMILSVAPATPQPVTVTYKVCSGEYERACKAHDVYQYCYADIQAWASKRCGSYTVQRLDTYGGNKCGYSIDSVVCTAPR